MKKMITLISLLFLAGCATGSSPTVPTNPLVDSSSPKEVVLDGVRYEIAFSDEFNGDSINYEKWNTAHMWGPDLIINEEKQYYIDTQNEADDIIGYNPFDFNSGVMSITADVTDDSKKAATKDSKFLSGVLTTKNKFTTKYGYFEARVKIPHQTGTFPAFWLMHDRLANQNTKRFEIDIFESLGHETEEIHQTLHHYLNTNENYFGWHVQEKNPVVNSQEFGLGDEDFASDFHVYAVKWEEGKVTWYIDGKETNSITKEELQEAKDAIDHEDIYIIINLAMGGTWINTLEWGGLGYNYPNAEDLAEIDADPAQLQIDYIRAYKVK